MASETAQKEMNELISNLGQDLREKWTKLDSMNRQPGLHITEHFFSLRTEIDIASENGLVEPGLKKKDEKSINSTREKLILALNAHEKRLLDQIKEQKKELAASEKRCAAIQARIEAAFFHVGKERRPIGEYEDRYEELASELYQETNMLERLILANQTFIFVPHDPKSIGMLIHLEDDYLSPIEVKCLLELMKKANQNFPYSVQMIRLIIQKKKNELFRIFIHEPRVLTKSIALLAGFANAFKLLASTFKSREVQVDSQLLAGNYFSIEPVRDKQVLRFFEANVIRLLGNSPFSEQGLESIESENDPFEYFVSGRSSIQLNENKLKSFNLPFSDTASDLRYFDLSYNNIAEYDEDFFWSLINCRTLNLLETFKVGSDFNLDFIANLNSLRELYATLPTATFDFNLLKDLYNLSELTLMSAAYRDVNVPKTKLDPEAMRILTTLPLSNLSLFGFEMEIDQLPKWDDMEFLVLESVQMGQIDANILKKLSRKLTHLHLRRNSIETVVGSAFKNFVHLKSLDLSGNRIAALPAQLFHSLKELNSLQLANNMIDDLPQGIFDSLQQMTVLNLSGNRLRRIKAGIFDRCERVTDLHLTKNPIETIESKAFIGLGRLTNLCMDDCKLETIESGMLKGLGSLETLHLARNQISAFLLKVDGRDEPINPNDASLTEEEMALVKKHMFVELQKLRLFDLNGNLLDAFDLLCFYNLSDLRVLKLSNNRLSRFTNNYEITTLAQVHSIQVNNNRLERLADGFFRTFPELETLELMNNQLSMKFDEHTFAHNPRLLELKHEGNRSIEIKSGVWRFTNDIVEVNLESPSPDVFDDDSLEFSDLGMVRISKSNATVIQALLKKLKPFAENILTLKFAESSLTTLDGFELGVYAPELNDIELPGNLLKKLEPAWLKGFTSLETLDLSNNLIEIIDDPSVLSECQSLEFLHLNGNKLSHIHRAFFRNLSDLYCLNLSNNNLESLDESSFRDLVSLSELDLSNNRFKRLDIAKLFRNTFSLSSLNLSRNQLNDESINATSIKVLESHFSLLVLNLAHNELTDLSFIRDLTLLQELSLSHNKIESIRDQEGRNLFGRLTSLTYIDLSHNRIRSVKPSAFDHMLRKIKHLDLSGNVEEAMDAEEEAEAPRKKPRTTKKSRR